MEIYPARVGSCGRSYGYCLIGGREKKLKFPAPYRYRDALSRPV